MRVSLRLKRPTAGGAALSLLRAVLVIVGLACLAGFLWLQYESRVVAAQLKEQFAQRIQQSAAGAPAPPAAANGLIGRLTSERLGLDVMVLEGEEEAQLRKGAGLIDNTAFPGEPGNMGLAAHRDTFFRPLREVKVGDRLELDTLAGRYEYEVEWTRIVNPTAVEVLDPTPEPALTLVTCYPFNYIGSAPQRFIVRAKRTAVPTPPTATVATVIAEAPEDKAACGATAAIAAHSAQGKHWLDTARRAVTALAADLGL